MKAQLLQEASYNLESGVQKFCCDEAGLLLLEWLSRQERHFFTGAKAAGTEERSLNLNLLWKGAGTNTFTVATQNRLSLGRKKYTILIFLCWLETLDFGNLKHYVSIVKLLILQKLQ